MPFFSITSPSSGNATQLQGKAVNATAPATGSVLTYDGSAWNASQGVTGPTGAQGADGARIFYGSTGPASNIGRSGDFYIDGSAGVLYGPKASGAWGSGLLLQSGPTGPIGTQGATGPSGGPTGSTGPTGAAASAGANVQSITGTMTLGPTAPKYQFIKPLDATRDVVLPTGAAAGRDFVIKNTDSTSYYSLQVKTNTSTGVVTLSYESASALVVFDGTNWMTITLG
jgi:hypothetical protein